jgi:hypothetical protein
VRSFNPSYDFTTDIVVIKRLATTKQLSDHTLYELSIISRHILANSVVVKKALALSDILNYNRTQDHMSQEKYF